MSIGLDHAVATLAELGGLRIGPADIGKSVYVSANTTRYEAMREGAGLDKWRADTLAADIATLQGLNIQAYQRVFDHADTDVAVAAATVSIDLGSALPATALVLGVGADVTEAFTNSSDAFSADVGVSGGTDNAYTATPLDIDGGIAFLQQWATVFAGGVTLAVTIDSDGGDLDTLTAGTVEITVYYAVPTITVEVAP